MEIPLSSLLSSRSLQIGLVVVLSCSTVGPAAAEVEDASSLDEAARAAAEGRWELALEQLRELFEAGYPTPADVYADPRFSLLRESGEARGKWRELMSGFVRESRIHMVVPDEPGEPMLVRGRIVDRHGAPIPNAVVQFYHTDATGYYEPDRPVGDGSNPRLFGFVRSDARGRFEVRTIRPAAYPGANSPSAHVHYRIHAEGYRDAADEFRPHTRPETAAERESALARGRPTSVVGEENGLLLCEVTLPMEPSYDREPT